MTIGRLAFAAALLGCLCEGCSRERTLSTSSDEALRQYRDGVSLNEKFYYAEAKEAFERSLKADSTFAMAWTRLATLNASLKNEPEALKDIAKAVQEAPRASRREQLFVSMWNNRLHFDTKAAIAAADSLIAMYPDEKEVYLFRGNFYEMNQNLDAAIRSYQKATDLDTAYAPAVMSLGYAYSAINEQQKALAQMQRYIRLAPEAADPLASYADLLVRAGRYDEALDQYRKSLELKPDYWYSVARIGAVYATLGRLDEAQEQFHRAMDLLPPSPQLKAQTLATDAGLNVRRGKYEEAIRQFTEALAMDSTGIDAAVGMVGALARVRRFSEAERAVQGITREYERQRLTGSAAMVGFYLMKARLLTEQDSLDAARLACGEALESSSPLSRGDVYQQLAKVHLQQKAFEPALDDCEEALRVNPNAPQTLLVLARIYHEKGDARMTREIGGRLLALWKNADPDFVDLKTLKSLLPTRSSR